MATTDYLLKKERAGLAAGKFRLHPAPIAFFALLALFATGLVIAFAQAVDTWTWAAWAALPLMAVNAIWISGGAATAVLGLFTPRQVKPAAPEGWQPKDKTAILITLCEEPPEPVAAYLASLFAALDCKGLPGATRIFILSDTNSEAGCAREEAAFAALIAEGRVSYRRRSVRTNKKPGNIADWFAAHGEGFAYMVVLDADSRMSAGCIHDLIWTMESAPRLGLAQAGISLVPGRTRFGKYQRTASRLLSPVFGKGFAAWSGTAGNYWGHNAIIRTRAFEAAVDLPILPGAAPLGGAILSHDFIEAAYIRRAGWDVVLLPDARGSAEDAPQSFEEYFRRDRRWCQGNLQHMRLLAEPGLHGLSRFHLVCGIFSYLAAPIWLVLVALLSSEAISVWGFLSVLSIAAVLMVPKLCALIAALPRARTARRKGVFLRASLAELGLSTLLAPVIMVRQAGYVAAVLMGRDSGWKSGQAARAWLPQGWAEAGLGLLILSVALVTEATGAFWLALVILPLLAAPVVMPRLDRVAR